MNTEITINEKADEVIEERFESLLNRYQIGLETSMRGSDFTFTCVHLLYNKCLKKSKLWQIIYRFSWLDKK